MKNKQITFSKNVFIPVTDICQNHCAYCTFRRDVHNGRIISISKAIQILQEGVNLGCSEALFSMGQSPEKVPGFNYLLREIGYDDIIEYTTELCKIAIDLGLLPHTNAGILSIDDLYRLKPYNASMGMMLESSAKLKSHKDAPLKDPKRRQNFIEMAGRLRIPFTTGILVGIGESWLDTVKSIKTIADLHKRLGHIQEVIIQPFDPKPGTPMENIKGPSIDYLTKVVKMAREILPNDIAIQIPPNLIDPLPMLDAGANDLGGLSPITLDWINPKREWPEISSLSNRLRGYIIRERLAVYPNFIKKEWYGQQTSALVRRNADASGMRRKSISSSGCVSFHCEKDLV